MKKLCAKTQTVRCVITIKFHVDFFGFHIFFLSSSCHFVYRCLNLDKWPKSERQWLANGENMANGC